MNYKMPRWLRSLVIVTMGILFATAATAVVYAVQNPSNPPIGGQTRAGDHNWKDVEVLGDDLCRSCHFQEHNVHGGNNTCSDCHAPNNGDHAARVVTCTTCHNMHGGGFANQSNGPLPDPTTTTTPTTSSTTSTTAAPITTTTTVAPTTTSTIAPTTTTTSAAP